MTTVHDPTATESGGGTAPPTLPVRLALTTLTAAAGAIHLVMVPGHSQESTLDGILFLLAGWTQIGLAVAVLAWPRRPVLQASIAVNLLAAGAWTVSRTVGLPFGANPGDPEPAAAIDQLTTGMEVVAVLLAAAVLARPGLWRTTTGPGAIVGAIVPVAVLVATSVVLSSPEAANHHATAPAGGATAQAAAARARCDLGFNPVSYWREATVAGWDTVNGSTAASSTATPPGGAPSGAGHHGGGAAPSGSVPSTSATPALPSLNGGRGSAELDRLVAVSTGAGEAEDAALVSQLAEVSDDTYSAWLQRLSTLSTHSGPQHWTALTDQRACDTLADELAQARAVAERYPTPADAKAAGYVQVTTYVPGIAAHFMNFSYVDDTFAIDQPEMLLYDGTGDDASVVGLSYYLVTGAAAEPTQGFTGDNDRYHVHDGLCVKGTLVIGDTSTSAEDCAARGGAKLAGGDRWMSHAWVVPGCESPWGVFSAANPLLDPELASQSGTDGGGCAGSGVRDRYDLTPGTTANTPTTVNGTAAQVAAP